MCSLPVTLGGGMRITNGGLSLPTSGANAPDASHAAYHALSNEAGSKRVGRLSVRFTRPSMAGPAGV